MKTGKKLMLAFGDNTLTPGQRTAVDMLDEFLASPVERCFLLKGYAGTGKTFLLKALADYLVGERRIFSLLAPTGRAARVLQMRAGYAAHTIHRAIYALDRIVEHAHADDAFRYYYGLREVANEETDCVFIIDEASMVSDRESEGEFVRFGSGRLLSDLVRFALLDCPNLKSKLIFVGDPAQLPPVTDGDYSPALDAGYLREHFNCEPLEYELTDVVRQVEGSGITHYATRIRNDLRVKQFNRLEIKPREPDVRSVNIRDLPNVCLKKGAARQDTICITYTNRTALTYNRILRGMMFGEDGRTPPQPGDRLIVVCNNGRYGVLNGDLVEVVEVDERVTERTIGMKNQTVKSVRLEFREVVIARTDEDGTRVTQPCMIIENLLLSPERDITRMEQLALYLDFKNRNRDLKPNTDNFREALREDVYFNALKVKYGYAVTCHKAQGGEWDRAVVVFEKRDGWDNPAWFRWCYTAITRAKRELLTVNAPRWSALSGLADAISNALPTDSDAVPAGAENDQSTAFIPWAKINKVADTGVPPLVEVNPGNMEVQGEMEAFVQAKLAGYKVLLAELGIELLRIEHNPESWYLRLFLKQNQKTACLHVYYTKRHKFKDPQWIRQSDDSEDLLKTAEEAFARCQPLWPALHHNQTMASGDTGEPVFPEDRPYLADMYHHLGNCLKSDGIIVTNVEHLAYAERYTFNRGAEKAIIDFSYNGKGQFRSPRIQKSLGNSTELASGVLTRLVSISK